MFRMRTLLTGWAILGCALTAAADTIYVNGDCGNDAWSGTTPDCVAPDGPKATIQAALDAANPSDFIEIADGTYTGSGNRDLDMLGKPVTVRSASGVPALCIVDCEAAGRGFHFHSAETADSVIEGLTISNGYVDGGLRGSDGGGVYCEGSSPTIRNCVITGNSVHYPGIGGGIACRDSSPMVTECTISWNWAEASGGGVGCFGGNPQFSGCTIGWNSIDFGSGGGIACLSSGSARFADCVITDNVGADGGGIACWQNNSVFYECLVAGNDADSGGGVHCYQCDPAFSACTIQSNEAGTGGGFCCEWGAAPMLTRCVIRANLAFNGGGVLVTHSSSPTLMSCLIAANSASSGGGVFCDSWSCTPSLTNCTICDNEAWYLGGALRSGSAVLTNCILWNDIPDEISFSDSTVSFCDVQGGWGGAGNIDADPLFVDPDGPDNDPATWEDNDYRLSAGSPCIDAGDSGAVPADGLDLDGDGDVDEPVPFDLDGLPRFVDDPDTADTGVPHPSYPDLPIVAMGAYEFQAGPAYNPGDLNCDGVVSPADIDPFVIALTAGQAAYEAQFPDCNYLNADCNDDGIVSAADIDPFVGLLTQ
jgi:hypothetical protein